MYSMLNKLLQCVLASLLVFASLSPVVVLAEEKKLTKEEKEARLKYKDKATRQRHSVGKTCAKKLDSFGELSEAEDWAGAEAMLDGALKKSCTSGYEKSKVWIYQGFVFYSQDKTDQAIDAYRKVISEPESDPKEKTDIRYTVAQLLFMQERYREAVDELELWISESAIVDRGGRILLAKGYYQLKEVDKALEIVVDVVDETVRSELVPKEGWLTFQWALLYEKEDFQGTVPVSYMLLTHYPKIKYWKQLSAMYSAVGESEKELLSLEVTYLQDGLDKEKQFVALAYSYLAFDMPYQAAVVLDKAMKEEKVERSEKYLGVLGSAYQRAQEFRKASPVLEEAAKKATKGNTYSRLASVYLNLNENEKALVAARNALKKGGLKREDLAWMNKGSAEAALHCYSDAVESFTKAAKFEKTKKNAGSWKQYVQKEGDRRRKLIASGAKLATCKKV